MQHNLCSHKRSNILVVTLTMSTTKATNPFPIAQYKGPKDFCDRNTELSTLLEAFDNQRPCLLHAIRRIGKTGLIHHFQHHLNKKRDVITIYFDILDTQSDGQFVNKMIQACISAIEVKQDGFIERLTKYFSRLKPTLSFDPYTGAPEIELDIRTHKDVQVSLSTLAEMLGQLKIPIQISIDEFQQIANYENTLIDASIRSYFHKMPNVHFLFSGSQRSLLIELFNNSKKAMFGSVQQVTITHIEPSIYHSFIKKKFSQRKVQISDEAIGEILEWTNIHTFYTQYFCNKLYAHGYKKITEKEVAFTKSLILKEQETTFLSYRNLLSSIQWKLLQGIANEGFIEAITSSFLQQYGLAESSARQSLKSLLDKEMIYEEMQEDATRYYVYDQFLSRWLSQSSRSSNRRH